MLDKLFALFSETGKIIKFLALFAIIVFVSINAGIAGVRFLNYITGLFAIYFPGLAVPKILLSAIIFSFILWSVVKLVWWGLEDYLNN